MGDRRVPHAKDSLHGIPLTGQSGHATHKPDHSVGVTPGARRAGEVRKRENRPLFATESDFTEAAAARDPSTARHQKARCPSSRFLSARSRTSNEPDNSQTPNTKPTRRMRKWN